MDDGFVFRVWAPHAQAVSVTGDFNFWNEEDLPMHRLGSSGVWEAVSKFAKRGSAYKYCVTGANGSKVYKMCIRDRPWPDRRGFLHFTVRVSDGLPDPAAA